MNDIENCSKLEGRNDPSETKMTLVLRSNEHLQKDNIDFFKETDNRIKTQSLNGYLKGKWLAMLLPIFLLYITIGGIIFHFIEHPYSKKTVASNLDRIDNAVVLDLDWIDMVLANNSCINAEEIAVIKKTIKRNFAENAAELQEMSWDITSSMFFSATIVTTIGYGNISPMTRGGRIFAVFYSIFGISLFILTFGEMGIRLREFSQRLSKRISVRIQNERLKAAVGPMIVSTAGYLIFSIGAAVVFSKYEGWLFSDSVYYTFITLTTIGLGDFYPSSSTEWNHLATDIFYRVFVIIWIIGGLVWMAFIISAISNMLRHSMMVRNGNDQTKHRGEMVRPPPATIVL
ncbi:potassium channel subfamily K member 16-like [Watersipora subatra]|uniref:potassium channel subfamily K member 16-like n=1 Tax=Watersipora subatra TaxID=2589382 RepID=UPI00355C13AE